MMLRFGAVLRAFQDGFRRAASAPAVFAGTVILSLVVTMNAALTERAALAAHLDVMATAWIHGVGPLGPRHWLVSESSQPWFLDLPAALTWALFWAFLSGGILDRYARNRPTRGRGFFAACGAHFPALFRLGILVYFVHAAASLWLAPRLPQNGFTRWGVMVVLFGVSLLLMYARVRLVVEDRRSAVGALLGAGRFIRRNPAALGLHLAYSLPATGTSLLLLADPTNGSALALEAVVVLQCFLILASLASATAFFQARLAHASYTAGPPLEWPESPAAEAITNLSPTPHA